MGFFDYLFGTDIGKDDEYNIFNDKEKHKEQNQPMAFNEETSEEISVENDVTTEPWTAGPPEYNWPGQDTSLYSGLYGSNGIYASNGVNIQDVSNMIKLTYSGKLAQDGAPDVYAVVGYGSNLKWENVSTYKMQPVGNKTFELMFPVNYAGNINAAFKDGSENWDNNDGMNYSCINEIYKGGQ